MGEEKEVFGSLIMGFVQACKELRIVAGEEAGKMISGVEPLKWYPWQLFKDLEQIVIKNYKNSAPILERAGMEMMISWYNQGPGKNFVKKGVDFLKFQSSSEGYYSVVKGPKEFVGDFELVSLDEKKGEAEMHSTTPMSRDMERGVLIGGMTAPGDLAYIDVKNDKDKNIFKIKFA